MDIREFCQRFKISLRKAREMQKDGYINLEASPEEHRLWRARRYLHQNAPLPALTLVELVENPEMVEKLGEKAAKQIEALDKPKDSLAPRIVSGCIIEASEGDRQEIERLAAWMRDATPDHPVQYGYFAVRILLNILPPVREKSHKQLLKAIKEARKTDTLAGYFRIDNSGARSKTIYQKPKNPLASMDL